MVPEFKHIQHQPANASIPPTGRKLSTHIRGSSASDSHQTCNVSTDNNEGMIKIGIHYEPDEFAHRALEIGHPTRLHSFFPDDIREVAEHCLFTSTAEVARSRTAEIKRWMVLKESLVHEERALKETMTERRKSVLKDKSLLLFKKLLTDSGHGDCDIVDQLTEGFDLTGPLPESRVFSRKVRPASISCKDLRRISDMSREGMIQTVKASGDPILDEQLYAGTQKEVAKGFLVGPLDPDKLPAGASLTRRFGVRQKNKTRPIDDYKASFVNASVSQSETATVHSVDHIASMIAYLLRMSDHRTHRLDLVAKTWDLADAYKQIPLSDHAFDHDAYLVVYCPSSNRAEIYQQKVLPFGSVASVTAFLRVAHGIWKIGSKLLKLTWSSYFDDFFSVTPSELARHTDLVIASMFNLLGWKLSSDKLIDYHTICKVLGVEFDLRMSGDGLSLVGNTEERVKELCESLDSILESKVLRRSEGERLRGRLQFASGQLFGRSARNTLRLLSKHIAGNRQTISDDTANALSSLKQQLHLNVPRKITGPMSDHVHIYVDASFDIDGYTGIGGVAYTSTGALIGFFSEQIPKSFLLAAMSTHQQTMIQELEMLSLLTAADIWFPELEGLRVVAFSDSESVRGSFLKNWSLNDPCSKLLKRLYLLEEKYSCQIWIERVPSQSNPSDHLSRSQVAQWKGFSRVRVNTAELWNHSASSLG